MVDGIVFVVAGMTDRCPGSRGVSPRVRKAVPESEENFYPRTAGKEIFSLQSID